MSDSLACADGRHEDCDGMTWPSTEVECLCNCHSAPLPGQVDMFGKVVGGKDVDSYV